METAGLIGLLGLPLALTVWCLLAAAARADEDADALLAFLAAQEELRAGGQDRGQRLGVPVSGEPGGRGPAAARRTAR